MRGRHASRDSPDPFGSLLVEKAPRARPAARSVARATCIDLRVVMRLKRWQLGLLTVLLATVVMGTVMVRDSDGPKRGVVRSVFLDARPVLDPFLIELQERTFRFFWDTATTKNGLIPDRYPTPSFSSIAAVGFGLTAYPIGVERGYVTRAAPRQRALATLHFFPAAPHGAS